MLGKLVLIVLFCLLGGDCHHARGNVAPIAPEAAPGGWVCAGWVAAPLIGAPAICHPIDIGNAPSLSWGGFSLFGGSDKFNVNSSYARNDLDRLVGDTLGILIYSDDTFVHMETIRRAVIYMTGIGHGEMPNNSGAMFSELATELKARVLTEMVEGGGDELSQARQARLWFATGYLHAAYRQANHVGDDGGGEAYLEHAVAMRPDDGAMRLGAAIAMYGHGSAEKTCFEHLGRAVALASDESGSLRENLMGTFGHFLGTKTYGELARKVHEHLKRV